MLDNTLKKQVARALKTAEKFQRDPSHLHVMLLGEFDTA